MNGISTLALKLGAAVEHLWSVLITQAPISSTIDILTFVIILIGLFFAVKFVMKNKRLQDDGEKNIYGDDDLLPVISYIVLGFFVFFVSVWFVCSLEQIIAGYVNPEYWALREVLDALKPAK